MNPESQSPNAIQQVLHVGKAPSRLRRYRPWLIGAALVVLAGALWLYFGQRDSTAVQYQSAEVKRGDLTVTVTATGVLQPVNQVDVGTEISGTVKSVSVDFNDHVKVGQVMARLGTDQLEAKLRQSQAALELANATVKEAQATALETATKLRRLQELQQKGLGSQDEIDTAQASADRAQATLNRARAQVTQAAAQLDADRNTLSKTAIISPINGIVLKRQIEPGQTVAASFQTPVLFTLAETMTQMELQIAVDEADVGQVKEGQQASFNVDAYADRSFPARITQVRFAPKTVEGVVTYEAVLSVDNTELLLRPGMTATAAIIVKQLHDVVQVPNAALRFRPPVVAQKKASGGLVSSLFSRRPPSSGDNRRKDSDAKSRTQRVWQLADGVPRAIEVHIGATDGSYTEIVSGELEPGAAVLTDVTSKRK